jgi:hypothetical protein
MFMISPMAAGKIRHKKLRRRFLREEVQAWSHQQYQEGRFRTPLLTQADLPLLSSKEFLVTERVKGLRRLLMVDTTERGNVYVIDPRGAPETISTATWWLGQMQGPERGLLLDGRLVRDAGLGYDLFVVTDVLRDLGMQGGGGDEGGAVSPSQRLRERAERVRRLLQTFALTSASGPPFRLVQSGYTPLGHVASRLHPRRGGDDGLLEVEGVVLVEACTEAGCDAPRTFVWRDPEGLTASVMLGPSPAAAAQPPGSCQWVAYGRCGGDGGGDGGVGEGMRQRHPTSHDHVVLSECSRVVGLPGDRGLEGRVRRVAWDGGQQAWRFVALRPGRARADSVSRIEELRALTARGEGVGLAALMRVGSGAGEAGVGAERGVGLPTAPSPPTGPSRERLARVYWAMMKWLLGGPGCTQIVPIYDLDEHMARVACLRATGPKELSLSRLGWGVIYLDADRCRGLQDVVLDGTAFLRHLPVPTITGADADGNADADAGAGAGAARGHGRGGQMEVFSLESLWWARVSPIESGEAITRFQAEGFALAPGGPVALSSLLPALADDPSTRGLTDDEVTFLSAHSLAVFQVSHRPPREMAPRDGLDRLGALPPPLLMTILGFLDVPELVTVTSASHFWLRTVNQLRREQPWEPDRLPDAALETLMRTVRGNEGKAVMVEFLSIVQLQASEMLDKVSSILETRREALEQAALDFFFEEQYLLHYEDVLEDDMDFLLGDDEVFAFLDDVADPEGPPVLVGL